MISVNGGNVLNYPQIISNLEEEYKDLYDRAEALKRRNLKSNDVERACVRKWFELERCRDDYKNYLVDLANKMCFYIPSVGSVLTLREPLRHNGVKVFGVGDKVTVLGVEIRAGETGCTEDVGGQRLYSVEISELPGVDLLPSIFLEIIEAQKNRQLV
ncbi:hypothetical protein [Chitinophaga sp. CF418]|uniref:hypothetical protein n=1 Tax=Chitinophaga sp. CF418 TaxID=1855287 RepID=UPI000913E896|nr:hypothetical protein [Chitinophaga sp. CF418]SHN42287.1 hypothetical protein SAMN05216311_114167 [Chitinophaga sp. CF418]